MRGRGRPSRRTAAGATPATGGRAIGWRAASAMRRAGRRSGKSSIDGGFSDYAIETMQLAVDGITSGSIGSARSMLEAIRPAFQFDAVESGGAVRFLSRHARAPVATVSPDELVLDESGRRFRQTRSQSSPVEFRIWRLTKSPSASPNVGAYDINMPTAPSAAWLWWKPRYSPNIGHCVTSAARSKISQTQFKGKKLFGERSAGETREPSNTSDSEMPNRSKASGRAASGPTRCMATLDVAIRQPDAKW